MSTVVLLYPASVGIVMKPFILSLVVVFGLGGLSAQTHGWQPSPGHAQIPIWPGAPPDAQFGPPANTETAPEPGEVDNVARAEAAVLDAINSVDPEEMWEEALLLRAAQVAIRAPREFHARPGEFEVASSMLPPELRRVLRLSEGLRRCFVLRMLVGLSRWDCAKLLHLSLPNVDQCICAAVQELARDYAESEYRHRKEVAI